MRVDTNSISIRELIEEACTKPSEDFGHLVPTVNHEILGRRMKEFRVKRGVQAVLVAKEMGFSKTKICFLEGGERPWNDALLKSYVRAVLAVEKKGSRPIPRKKSKRQ